MALASGVYLLNFWKFQFFIFSSQSQVNSNRIACFEDFENKTLSGCNSVRANWNGNS